MNKVNVLIGESFKGNVEMKLVSHVGMKDVVISECAHKIAATNCTFCTQKKFSFRENELKEGSQVYVTDSGTRGVFDSSTDSLSVPETKISNVSVFYRDDLVIIEEVGSFIFDFTSMILPRFDIPLDVIGFMIGIQLCAYGLEQTLEKFDHLDNVVEELFDSVIIREVNGSEREFSIDQDACGLENNTIISNVSGALENS